MLGQPWVVAYQPCSSNPGGLHLITLNSYHLGGTFDKHDSRWPIIPCLRGARRSDLADPRSSKRRLRWLYLVGFVPVALAALCCWSASRPGDPTQALAAAQEFDTEFFRSLEGIDRSEVEAYAIERRGGVIEIGFLLTKVEASQLGTAATRFEAGLFNLGREPVRDAYVTLRLFAEDGRLVETVDLKGEKEVIEPGSGQLVTAEYLAAATVPRIVEETLALESDASAFFTLYSYNETKLSPGLLSRIAALVPIVNYEAVWTKPTLDWQSFQVEFHYDSIVTN